MLQIGEFINFDAELSRCCGLYAATGSLRIAVHRMRCLSVDLAPPNRTEHMLGGERRKFSGGSFELSHSSGEHIVVCVIQWQFKPHAYVWKWKLLDHFLDAAFLDVTLDVALWCEEASVEGTGWKDGLKSFTLAHSLKKAK